MDTPDLPRFDAASRRAFLKRAAALGAIVAVPGALAACGKSDDSGTFADGDPTTSAAAGPTTTAATGSDASTTTAAATSGAALPDGANLEVAFTYAAAAGGFGPARNPFIAVWVEDADGALVAPLSVWYNPPKGDRWINNLSSWYSATSSSDVGAVTGASRPAGQYTVAWDGTGADGQRAPQGAYTVYVESAREHGPHSLMSAAIMLGTAAAEASMEDSTELTGGSASYSV